MKSIAEGFTLLEVMMTLGIVAILATIAIPNYQSYMQRAKFSEIIQAVGPYKMAVEICAQEEAYLSNCGQPEKNGILPDYKAPNEQTGYTASIHTGSNGIITATSQKIFIEDQKTFSYILVPQTHPNGQISWQVDPSSTCLKEALCR